MTEFDRNRQAMKKWAKASGLKDPELYKRRTGRSLARALKTLGQAIAEPNVEVSIVNHAVEGKPASRLMNEHLMREIEVIADTLSLENIVFNERALTVCFSITLWADL